MASPAEPETALPAGLEAVALDTVPEAERLALSSEAHWNQTAADWRRLLRLGRGFGLAEHGGPLVASAVLLPYESDIAWISMVLVTARWRRRGLASLLMREAVAGARTLGRTAFLDATPDGVPVYRTLGFVEATAITRWHRPAAAGAGQVVAPGEPGSWAEACARDARALGAPRRPLLEALAEDGQRLLLPGGSLLLRPGRLAWQVGPLVAEDRATAETLLAAGLAAVGGDAAFLDARDDAGLEPALQAAGFAPQRPFLRMHLGRPPAAEPALLWLTAGPEFG